MEKLINSNTNINNNLSKIISKYTIFIPFPFINELKINIFDIYYSLTNFPYEDYVYNNHKNVWILLPKLITVDH